MVLALLALSVLLTACTIKGKDLPDGMDEDTVRRAGLEVMNELCDGEYEKVYDALREDIREKTTADAIGTLMTEASDGLGAAGEVTDSMVTGVTDTDEPHAIAVLRRKYEKKGIYFRIAFDEQMQLVGLEIQKK